LTIKWAREYYKSIKYFMCDLFCDAITSCDAGKIDASGKIMFDNRKEKIWK